MKTKDLVIGNFYILKESSGDIFVKHIPYSRNIGDDCVKYHFVALRSNDAPIQSADRLISLTGADVLRLIRPVNTCSDGCGCKSVVDSTDGLRKVVCVDDLFPGMFYYVPHVSRIVEYRGYEKGSGDVDCGYVFNWVDNGLRLYLTKEGVLDSIHYVPDNLPTIDDLLFRSVLVSDDTNILNKLFLEGWIVWDVFVGSNNYLVILKSDGEC